MPNETTAFVSSSGGGKTTIFSLIERFYKVTAGEIKYGNDNIESYSLKEWRQLFGYVSQEAPLMNGTIRENVLYGKKDATEEEVKQSLIAAYAYDFVINLENDSEDRGVHTGFQIQTYQVESGSVTGEGFGKAGENTGR